MATGPCEVLERNEESPNSVKGLSVQKESIQQQLKEDRTEDANAPTNKEEVKGTPNGIEKGGGNNLHIIERDLDEFVDSMTEATPVVPPEAEKHLGPPQEPEKVPRAEQVAEKVLRAEKVAERASHVEKLPGTEKGTETLPQAEKMAEKAPRAEKAPEKVPRAEKAVEKTPRAEKPAEKTRPSAPKAIPAKRKGGTSPAKDTLPWEGLTLNKCILVASLVALLSVGCQVVQDILDFGEDIPDTEAGMSTLPESSPTEGSPGELEALWFYERWLRWPEDYEPPEPEEEEEEELEPEEIEEEVEPVVTEEEEEEEEDEDEDEEEEPEEPIIKAEPRKSREKLRGEGKSGRREKSSKGQALKDHKAPEKEEEEEKRLLGKHHRREKEQRPPPREEEKSRRLKHKEQKWRPQDDWKGRHKEGRERGEGPPHPPKREQDYKHPPQSKGRKAWHAQRPFFSHKDGAHKSGKHKFQEGKRHD